MMLEEYGWLSRRKRKTLTEESGKQGGAVGDGVGAKRHSTATHIAGAGPSRPPTSLSLPASLVPHLGWTKLSACHRPRAKRRKKRSQFWDSDEGCRRVAGRAMFFLHDPQPDGGTPGEDERKIWFQGRFFPSGGLVNRRDRDSPTSVAAREISAAPDDAGISWGLLAVQNASVDECLTCSEGGYRELDLTFIRPRGAASASAGGGKARWVAEDVVWTGGDMMALSSDPYSPSVPDDGPGVKFDPQKLMEGERAMGVADKCFPSMAKRLRIHGATGGCDKISDAMVIIGDMEIVAPVSFLMNKNSGDLIGDDDGLWSD